MSTNPQSTTPAGLTWEEPPATSGGRAPKYFTAEVMEALRANPGKWARIPALVPPNSARYARKKKGLEVRQVLAGSPKGANKFPTWARFPAEGDED